MTSTKQSLLWMSIFLAIVLAVLVAIFPALKTAFLANWVFNSLIASVLLVGIFYCYRQVWALKPEQQWIALFRTGRSGTSLTEPVLLKSLAKHLDEDTKRDRFSMSAMALRTILDGIRARLDESREISRYFISLLVFLGLLGTFWGLLGTIEAVGKVIIQLDINNSNFEQVFTELQAGLLEPLSGMGTAFSSSLLGLGGSLVLGFLDIQSGQAQNRFYDSLEEWLTGLTNLIDPAQNAHHPVVNEQIEALIAENEALKQQLVDKE
ncbi:hypothetical protein [Salinibius halmophilus]|uniref:hypothetical protein n=1 Tax=Salinibius halmophilus TaxID=1853216 RepID=UPI001F4571AF|nr:hypothetical protein [Salinibius halmophilus]